MKKVAVLGSTGSIGTQTLDVVRANDDLEVVGLAAGSNVEMLEKQIREFHPRLVAVWKEEAARDLGAGPFRAFRDITLPLIMPAVISGSLLAFAMSMDDVVISIFVNGPKLSTLPIKVYTQLKTGVTPEINALCTVILTVVILVELVSSLFQKKSRGSR